MLLTGSDSASTIGELTAMRLPYSRSFARASYDALTPFVTIPSAFTEIEISGSAVTCIAHAERRVV